MKNQSTNLGASPCQDCGNNIVFCSCHYDIEGLFNNPNTESKMKGAYIENEKRLRESIKQIKNKSEMDNIWKDAYIETPPSNKELLVKSPDGVHHLASYRIEYNIFTCQTKLESIDGWYYIVIEELTKKQNDN